MAEQERLPGWLLPADAPAARTRKTLFFSSTCTFFYISHGGSKTFYMGKKKLSEKVEPISEKVKKNLRETIVLNIKY